MDDLGTATESRVDDPGVERRPSFSVQTTRLTLLLTTGPCAGERFHLAQGTTMIIGAAGADWNIDDKTVSRQHVQVTWQGQSLRVQDMGSKNGSYYGRAQFSQIALRLGDEFAIGATTIKLLPDENPVVQPPPTTGGSGRMIGSTDPMRRLYGMIDKVAPSDAPVVLEGETGVGKELVARELHERSKRTAKPFVVFDCGAVPVDLLESLLFGHVRGAFTGAIKDQEGVFAAADGGTLFLDEIGELPVAMQPALLRVLDQGVVRAVGATTYQKVDVRVISATHRDLGAMIGAGQFREDLYYRLAVVRLTVPPLRARSEDVPALVEHFLQARSSTLRVRDEDMETLRKYPWPGNVRQLRNVVERGVIMSSDDTLSIDTASMPAGAEPRSAAGGTRLPFSRAKEACIAEFEKRYVTELLADHATMTAAALAADMDRKHLRLLVHRYNLQKDA